MLSSTRTTFFTLSLTAYATMSGLANASAEIARADLADIEQTTIIGSKAQARKIAGSNAVIDPKQITIEAATDINQLLRTLPGLYIREEDGEGLRPNIGIRAASAGRASKVTLLEDGVMIAPAPYSNPAAYYFPTAYRMAAIEVLKGAPLLRHGPQTTGGVINLVSTSVPEDFGGQVLTQFGENNSSDIHAFIGGTQGQWGALLETVQRNSDGFKDIDRSSRDAGFSMQDYVAKVQFTGDKSSFLAKAQYSEEQSNETYLGLADIDFNANENRRYGLTEIDQMDNSHTGLSLNYAYDFNSNFSLHALAYYNEFARNWYKLDGASSLITDANAGDADALAILRGELDVQGLEYKNNNREYESRGIELNVEWAVGDHQLDFGIREHSDDMDRFQPVDIYDQLNGSLVFQDIKAPSGSNNRLEGADATTLWIEDNWQASDALNLNVILRYEDVETFREQFSDSGRDNLASTRSNTFDELLPGISFTYDINQQWQVLGGAHRGFSPLGGGSRENQEPETSNNFEVGLRYGEGNFFAESIFFYSDFKDTAQLCSIATPCQNGADSGSFVLGESVVSGLEVQISNSFDYAGFTIPLDIAYTHTQAEISADNSVSGLQDGDNLRDIPENTFSVRVGLENNSGWNNYLVAKYTDEACVSVGCDRDNSLFATTESVFIVDYISRYALNNDLTVFFRLQNMFDQQRIVSRVPYGARPNKPQTASIGLQYSF